jgi:BirA family biotin operon repressor/biotin-[acetyl-CoA-carboxylase] ligase
VITVLSKPELVKEIEYPPLDVEAVRARLREAAARWRIRHLRQCSSTQELAEEAVRAGEAAGLVLSTDFQSAGRGRRGGSWTAPAGTGLLVSILLQPPPRLLPLTPLLAGIAVVDGIEACCGLRTELKWPNDVMVRELKLAGILVVSHGSTAIVGIGVNVASHPEGLGIGAASLASELGRPVAREPLLAAILDALAGGLRQAAASGPGFTRSAWLARSSMVGRRFAFEKAGVETIAVAKDLMEDGTLLAVTDGGAELRLVAGSVRHLRAREPQS